MTIQKQSASTLRKADIAYSVFPTQILSRIKNTDALAIWTYLLSKKDGWIVRIQDIQNHFEIGRDKARKAIKYLEDMDLIWREQNKDDKGHFVDNIIVCSALPRSLAELQEKYFSSRPTEKPSTGENTRPPENQSTGIRSPENPTVGKSVDLNKYRDTSNVLSTTTNNARENQKTVSENPPPENPLKNQPDFFYLHSLNEDQVPDWAQKAPKFYALRTPAANVWRGFVLHQKANHQDEIITIQKLSMIWDRWAKREKFYEENYRRNERPQKRNDDLTAIEQIRAKAKAAGFDL